MVSPHRSNITGTTQVLGKMQTTQVLGKMQRMQGTEMLALQDESGVTSPSEMH